MPPRSKRFSSGDVQPGASTLVIRNVTVLDKRTSLRMEPEMWDALEDVAHRERATVDDVCDIIVQQKPDAASLTAAIRMFLVNYYRIATTEEGHDKAGHGRGDIAVFQAALRGRLAQAGGVPVFSAK
jgi:predicted DNA-binding ribbon-helix-helix protein